MSKGLNELILNTGSILGSTKKFKLVEKETMKKLLDELGLTRWKKYLEDVEFAILVKRGKFNIVTSCDDEWSIEAHENVDIGIEDRSNDDYCVFAALITITPKNKYGFVKFDSENEKFFVLFA